MPSDRAMELATEITLCGNFSEDERVRLIGHRHWIAAKIDEAVRKMHRMARAYDQSAHVTPREPGGKKICPDCTELSGWGSKP